MPRRALPASPKNPFEFGRELNADELVDREAELELVRRTIVNRGRLFFIGPRRYGKTSVLHAAEELLSREGVVVLRHNAEACESVSLLAQALLTGAARRLAGTAEQVSRASPAGRGPGGDRPDGRLARGAHRGHPG